MQDPCEPSNTWTTTHSFPSVPSYYNLNQQAAQGIPTTMSYPGAIQILSPTAKPKMQQLNDTCKVTIDAMKANGESEELMLFIITQFEYSPADAYANFKNKKALLKKYLAGEAETSEAK